MYKISVSAVQLANCILLHTYSRSVVASSCASTKRTSYSLFNKLA